MKCTPALKISRGCEQDTPFPTWTDFEGKLRSRCPRRPILEEPALFNKLIAVYNNYDKGILPKAGGLYDQHARFPALMGIMGAAINECDSAKQEMDRKSAAFRNGS